MNAMDIRSFFRKKKDECTEAQARLVDVGEELSLVAAAADLSQDVTTSPTSSGR